VELRFDTVRAADHWILQSGRSPAYTTFVDGQVAVVFADPPEGARAVAFPGHETLLGILPISRVLASCAIERVRVLGGGVADPAQELDTRDFVRPQWMGGGLTLLVQPARDGLWVPFEVPNPTPCCADHS
jgi:hypothetical protein